MHSTKTQRKFIQLRSQGLSYARISEQIHVSKPTLLNWNRWFDEEIENLTALERESTHENLRLAHQADLTRLSKLHDTLEAELASRKLSEIPTEKLFRISQELRDQIQTAHKYAEHLEEEKPRTPDGRTRAERRLENINRVRIFRGLNPIDEDGNEIQLDPPPTDDQQPASPGERDAVNKQSTSPETPQIS